VVRDPVAHHMDTTGDQYLPDCKKLYDILLRPMEVEIAAAQHICMIPHGPLHFLPFHALHDGSYYLIERVPISYAPSATILTKLSVPVQARSVARLPWASPYAT
jgi:CHAT domain-containing protein